MPYLSRVHKASQEETYRAVAVQFAAPLQRLARGYEADSDKRRDLLQEIHVALWRGLDRLRHHEQMVRGSRQDAEKGPRR